MNDFLHNNNTPHYSSSLYEKKHMEFFHIDFSHVDLNGSATVTALTNFLQEAAWQHANFIKIGYFDMLKQNTAFVINKMLIKIRRLPTWNEMVSVETWLHSPKKVQALREFTVRDNNRNLIAAATISYIAINTETRKLSQIPSSVENCCMGEKFLDEEPSRILFNDSSVVEGRHVVKPSDIDMNQHVNNGQYIQWIFDNMPAKWVKGVKPVLVNLNFIHEAHLGDDISLYFNERCSRLYVNGFNKTSLNCCFLAEIGFK